jgi:hypothetical protein
MGNTGSANTESAPIAFRRFDQEAEGNVHNDDAQQLPETASIRRLSQTQPQLVRSTTIMFDTDICGRRNSTRDKALLVPSPQERSDG